MMVKTFYNAMLENDNVHILDRKETVMFFLSRYMSFLVNTRCINKIPNLKENYNSVAVALFTAKRFER